MNSKFAKIYVCKSKNLEWLRSTRQNWLLLPLPELAHLSLKNREKVSGLLFMQGLLCCSSGGFQTSPKNREFPTRIRYPNFDTNNKEPSKGCILWSGNPALKCPEQFTPICPYPWIWFFTFSHGIHHHETSPVCRICFLNFYKPNSRMYRKEL